ncbi:probable LRR receptor-like serine/threonine-protein kinase At3g47570 [Citrus sinensis]|uniref:probable LRR receptor-like serine/threonine-protein kinase At3g47570 n=1 Tax=Citrus clementina TaxID=85681 RepID=UPI000CED48E3|nr:probable LRR receptor-like serine/threonine-protein kinase At3g47570 [Citrus x clementina]XP_052287214.1 probable LRR receptor-like serine/threonine-protein kinase At3g47570 [Citrus sinensis]
MPNGSLEERLYSNEIILDIFQRLNIMINVASALEYLHFGHLIPVIHCDLKSSNVLLDDNMVAHLSDFGIAKLLNGEDQSMMRTQTLAIIGYMSPEYRIEGRVSTKADAYAYGIMLMETFSGKKPTSENFGGEMTLYCWGSLHLSLLASPRSIESILNIELDNRDRFWAPVEATQYTVLETFKGFVKLIRLYIKDDSVDSLRMAIDGCIRSRGMNAYRLGIRGSRIGAL